MPNALQEIRMLIDKGNKKEAGQRLKRILQDEPSADAWYLAALVVNDDRQKIKCLRHALKLDALHTPANRLLYTIEGGMPLHEQEKRKQQAEKRKTREIVPLEKIEREMKKDRFQRHAERQRRRTQFGCLFSFLLSASCSLFAISAIGLLPGFIGTVTTLLGGPAPVYDIDGTPIQERDDAIMVMTPAKRADASRQDVDIMDQGYLHEYQFDALQGETYAIYVQFMSVNANRVSDNVAIIDPEGLDAREICERERILEGDMGVAYICKVDVSGQWAVRVLGIAGESVGAYFVGVEALDF